MMRKIHIIPMLLLSFFATTVSCDEQSNSQTPEIVNPEIAPPAPVADEFCPENVNIFWTDLDSLTQEEWLLQPHVNTAIAEIYRSNAFFVDEDSDSLLLELSQSDLCTLPLYAEMLIRMLEDESPIHSVDESANSRDAASSIGSDFVALCHKHPAYLEKMLSHDKRYWQPALSAFVAHYYKQATGEVQSDRVIISGTIGQFDGHLRSKVKFDSPEQEEKWTDFVFEVEIGVKMTLEGF